MRVILPGKPFHRIGFSTMWAGSTYGGARKSSSGSAIGLFVLFVAATLTIFIRDPLVGWGYALGIFLLGGYESFKQIRTPNAFGVSIPGAALGMVSPSPMNDDPYRSSSPASAGR